MRKGLLASVSACALAVALMGPAHAGNIVLTGHDDDFHDRLDDTSIANIDNQPGQAMLAELKFVRSGSANPTLPVLSFDAGAELTASLTGLGISFVNINPSSPISPSVFDPTKYSAIVVASVTSCGGCDNTTADIANLIADKTAIASFFDAGGGILAFTAGTASSDANNYGYVPDAASKPPGIPPSTGYVQTAEGALLGIPAVNGDATHNFFSEPGTAGLSSAYQVVETLGVGGTPETVAVVGGTIVCTGPTCTITSGGSVPEPGTLGLFGTGLAALALRRRRKLKTT